MFEYASFVDGTDDDSRGALLLNDDGDVVFACQPTSILGGKDTVAGADWEAMSLADREQFTLLRWKLDTVHAQIRAGRKQLADDDTPLLGRLADMIERHGKPADDDLADRVVKLQKVESDLLAQLRVLRGASKHQASERAKTEQRTTKAAWLDDVDALIESLGNDE